MDKNLNVDDVLLNDILLDIKRRKIRRQEEGEQSASPALPEEEFPGVGHSGKNGVAYAPDSSAPKNSPADEILRELREKPARDPEEAPKGEPELEPERVDGQSTTYFKPVRGQQQNTEEPEQERPEKGRSPLDFDGHVRPLTDRAKIRKSKNEAARSNRGEATSVIDISKIRSSASGARQGEPFDGGTRVIPGRLGSSRELDMDEIRNMDFGEPEDEGYRDFDGDYDHDDYRDDREAPRPSVDFSEYKSFEDRRDVAIDIARTKLWLVIRTLVTTILTGALIYLALCGRYLLLPMPIMLDPENDLGMYLIALTALSVGVALAGSSAIGGGLISFFKMRSNSDSLAALAMLGAVGQCVFALARPELADPRSLTFYSALAALSMLFNALGKLSMISRIQANFKIISSDKQKKAVILANDDSFTREYLKGATRRPSIAISAKCDFFTDFLALSYSDKYDVGINKAVAPVCFLGSIVVGLLTYILTRNAMTAVTAMVGILCVSATLSATFIENVPLGKLTRKLAPRGGMVSGNKAVEDFCDVSAIVLNDKDLFPAGHVEILGMKTYSQGRVDEAIIDAASIAYAMNSLFGNAFLQMIGGNKKLLRKVDNASFENERGITAWIDGRRVLLGNRNLMKAYDVGLPDSSFEKKYIEQGGEPLFLASAGELAAQIIVGYKVDEELALELDRLGSMEKLLIIHTVDCTVTPHKIWELYGYPEELVQIMPAHQREQYIKMTAPRSSELAEIAYTGRASAMVGCILACMSARSSILAATTVQLIQIALGYGLIALMAFLGSIETLTIFVLGGYQLFWFIVIWLVQRLKAA